MHPHEPSISPTLVRRLLTTQFPQWADLPLTPIPSAGTDHAIYRLGGEFSVRLPRIDWAAGQAEFERVWLPRLAPQLPLAVPEVLAIGDPACDLMSAWSLFAEESRAAFREALDVDDATWVRGRGHALSQALIFIPYYLDTNPGGVAQARRVVEAVIEEVE